MNDPLIRTKLCLPFIRPGLVSRPRLQMQVTQGLCGPLTLITAPAGFGKTTLVASVVSHSETPIAWLSLDKNDNQIGRFLAYLLAAIREADPSTGSEASQMLAASQQPAPETILTSLINDLETARREIILILDDYQFISSQMVHEGVTFLLEHLPVNLHLVIATRSDPPLPLARLRARGQTIELRAADLRFSELEAAQFLNEVMGLGLDARSVALLEERTEGWIAGLQMAALSMRDRKDLRGFIESFSGTNRHILDYLLEEVLASQPPDIQHFLLYTSILDRLTTPLCDAILSNDKALVQSESPLRLSSASILEYLERANLFLMPLDDKRTWYRYHHLFADLLNKQLHSKYPERIPELHQIASRWYEINGFPYEAMEHAFRAEDYPLATHLLEQMSRSLLSQADQSWSWMLKWIQKLPEERIQSNLQLLVLKATLLASEGRVVETEECLSDAEIRLAENPKDSVSRDWFAGRAAAVRVMLATYRRDSVASLQNAQKALQMLSGEENLDWRAYLLLSISRINLMEGDLEASSRDIREALEIARSHKLAFMYLDATAHLTMVLWMQGHLREANQVCLDGQQYFEENGLTRSPAAGIFYINWGVILCEQHKLSDAEAVLCHGMELYTNASPLAQVWMKQIWTRYLIAKGDLALAEKTIQEIHSIQQQAHFTAVIRTGFSAVEPWVWIRLGKVHDADQYFINHHISAQGPIVHPLQWEYNILVRLLIIKGEFDAGTQLLKQLLLWAENKDQQFWVICYLLSLTSVYQARGNQKEALQTLGRAMELAEPDEIIQVFVDDGETLASLLSEAVRREIHPMFANRLLAALPGKQIQTPIVENHKMIGPGMVEPLSERELEVLRLLSSGRANLEIAKQLVISVGTVKAHTASIYRKLDVSNRTEAVARSRELGILP